MLICKRGDVVMKKTRLIPCLIMLILCVGVLAFGIYAVNPVSNQVIGTVNIKAASAEVEITIYLGENKATKISKTVKTRTSAVVAIYDDSLLFDNSNSSTASETESIVFVIELKNNSSITDLGAFFLSGDTLPTVFSSSDVSREKNYNATSVDKTTTLQNAITANLANYTQVPKGGSADLVCSLTLNEFASVETISQLDLPLIIHEYNSEMIPASTISASAEIDKSSDENTATITTSGSGTYAVGSAVTLNAVLENEGTSFSYAYIWYARGINGAWTQVGTGKIYTYTVVANSPTEYKVVCLIKKFEPVNITCMVESQITNNINVDGSSVVVPTVTISGCGEYEIGSSATLVATLSGGNYDGIIMYWAYKGTGGEWVRTAINGNSYLIDSVSSTITEYKLHLSVYGNFFGGAD